MNRVRFHSEAFQELEESQTWYEAQMPGLGADFLSEVEEAVKTVRDHPLRGARLTGDVRRSIVHRFPYGLVYRVVEDTIQIVAVMHLHRRPGYWMPRLRPEK